MGLIMKHLVPSVRYPPVPPVPPVKILHFKATEMSWTDPSYGFARTFMFTRGNAKKLIRKLKKGERAHLNIRTPKGAVHLSDAYIVSIGPVRRPNGSTYRYEVYFRASRIESSMPSLKMWLRAKS